MHRYAHMYVGTYVRTYVYMQAYTHTYVHTYVCVYMLHTRYIFTRTCQSLYIEVSSWMIRMESTAKHTKNSLSVRHRASLFINGLLSAYKITHYVKTMMNYHSHMRIPMTKSTLLHLCKLLELLKVVTTMDRFCCDLYTP